MVTIQNRMRNNEEPSLNSVQWVTSGGHLSTDGRFPVPNFKKGRLHSHTNEVAEGEYLNFSPHAHLWKPVGYPPTHTFNQTFKIITILELENWEKTFVSFRQKIFPHEIWS